MIKVQLGIKRASGRYDNLPFAFETEQDFEEFQDKLIAKGDKLIGIKTIKDGMDK